MSDGACARLRLCMAVFVRAPACVRGDWVTIYLHLGKFKQVSVRICEDVHVSVSVRVH